MGRKYGLGKYGAGTYDLETVHEIIAFEGAISFVVTIPTATLINTRQLMGHMIIEVDITGQVGHTARFEGLLSVDINIVSVDAFIGPQWGPESEDNWCDVPEGWIPITIPNLPCKVPL
jgi:hypothetical protein